MGRIIDWKSFEDAQNPHGFNVKNSEHKKRLAGAIQYFLALPNTHIPAQFMKSEGFQKDRNELRDALTKVQHFGTAADFPATVLRTLEKYHMLPIYDNGWEYIYDVRDFSGERRDGFSIENVTSPIVFRRVAKGDTLDVYQMSGTKAHVDFHYYGAGLSIHRGDLENGEYWTVEDNIIAFRNEAYRSKAQRHYTLLEVAATLAPKVAIPWAIHPDGVAVGVRGYLAGRDAQTINNACQQILLACVGKGYGIAPESVNFIILTPIQRKSRVKQALAYSYDNVVGSPARLDYNVTQITTTMLASTTNPLVILPKLRIKSGVKMDLTLFEDFDLLSYANVTAGWQQDGQVVGDADQIASVTLT